MNAVAAGSLVPRHRHEYYLLWKCTTRLPVPCRSAAAQAVALASAPPVPCQSPTNSDNWEHISDTLSFNQFLLRSFAARWHYNSLQTIKALHLSWVIRGLRPAILVINFFLGGIAYFCIFEQCWFSIR